MELTTKELRIMQQWQSEKQKSAKKDVYIKEIKKPRKKLKRSKLSFVSLVSLLLIVAGVMVYQTMGKLSQINTLEDDLTTNKQALQVADNYQDELQTYVSMLEDDDYIAKLARSEYYLTDDDDIVFNFVDGNSSILSDVTKSAEQVKK